MRVTEGNDAFENAYQKFAVCSSLTEKTCFCFSRNWQLRAGQAPVKALSREWSVAVSLTGYYHICLFSQRYEKQLNALIDDRLQLFKSRSLSRELQPHLTHTRNQPRCVSIKLLYIQTRLSERSEPSSSHSSSAQAYQHTVPLYYSLKKEPDLTLNPIKVTTRTAYGLLHNKTNTIMFWVAFLLCLSENPVPHSETQTAWPRKATSKQWNNSLGNPLLRLFSPNWFIIAFSAISHSSLEAVVNMWFHFRQRASKSELEIRDNATCHAWRVYRWHDAQRGTEADPLAWVNMVNSSNRATIKYEHAMHWQAWRPTDALFPFSYPLHPRAHTQDKQNRNPLMERQLHRATGGQKLHR